MVELLDRETHVNRIEDRTAHPLSLKQIGTVESAVAYWTEQANAAATASGRDQALEKIRKLTDFLASRSRA